MNFDVKRRGSSRTVNPLSVARRIHFGASDDDCWIWLAHIDQKGYGSHSSGVGAYRVTYELWRGPIPSHLVVDHLCRNRKCVNPWHLELVTRAENVRRGAPATKTHCVNGHEFTPENTYPRSAASGGQRGCLECTREAQRRYQHRKRMAAA